MPTKKLQMPGLPAGSPSTGKTPSAGMIAAMSSGPLAGPKGRASRLLGLAQATQSQASKEANPEAAAYQSRVASSLKAAADLNLALAQGPTGNVPMSPDRGAPSLPYPGGPGGSPLPKPKLDVAPEPAPLPPG